MGKRDIYYFRSNLSLAECLGRLRHPPDVTPGIGNFDLGFKISLFQDIIQVSKKTQLNNPFSPHFQGIIKKEGNETIISGEFKIQQLIKIVSGFLLGVGTLIATVFYVFSFFLFPESRDNSGMSIIDYAFPIIWVLAVVCVIIIGRWFARNDKKEVTRFLKAILDINNI